MSLWLGVLGGQPTVSVPGAPTGLTATSGDEQVSLSWNVPSDNGGTAITGYAVQRATDSEFTANLVTTTGLIGTSTTVTGLSNGTTYYFKVAAENAIGTGAYSGAASATPFAPLALSYASQDFATGSDNSVLSPTVSGGYGTKAYSLSSGSLPAGITLNTSTGAITGPASTVWGGWHDTSFGNGLSLANNNVISVAVQSDGKILIGGYFNAVNGVSRNYVARLNTDGSLDTSFGNGLSLADNFVNSVAVQSDGKILIGGQFNSVNGVERWFVARLNTDGSVDTSFGNGISLANSNVNSVAVQSDGKILIGGWFNVVNGVSRNYVARLNTGGSVDTSFGNGISLADSNVNSIAVQSDGKILIGGYFNAVNGVSRNYVARLNTDGSLDTSFGNGISLANNNVLSVAVQSDGKILIGGQFTNVNGVQRWSVARLNTDGSVDTSFGNGFSLANNYVRSIAVQSDGKILIGGLFTTVGGVQRGGVARLNTDGSVDTSFGNGLSLADSNVNSVAVQSDGKILIGGNFSTVNGVSRGWFARLMGGVTPALPATVGVTVTDSSGSQATSVTLTQTWPPSTVQSLTTTSVAPSVGLTWSAPATGGGAFSYTVEYSGTSASGPWTTWSASQSNTSATVTGLTTGAQYWFRVTAINASGSATAVTTAYGKPDAPTGLTATPGYQQISYTWTAPAVTGGSISDYILQRSSDGITWTTVTDGVSTATSYTLTGLANAESVRFRVAAANTGNTSDFTAPVTATTPTPKATGGTIAYSGGNMIHTFTASGTFTPTVSIASASGLCAAGGYNGTGGGSGGSGAGGSGGQVTTGTQAISTARTITVGGVGGGTSSISGWLTSTGVGLTGPAGRNTAGAGAAGAAGTTSSISGASVVYGSSGGAGGFSTTTTTQNGGAGGSGAGNGGRGRSTSTSGNSGGAASSFGSGGGGGGGTFTTSGGAGRQGVVIISYPA